MNCGSIVEFGTIGEEKGRLGAGSPAFRCGLPLGGGEWPDRNAGSRFAVSAVSADRAVINITWSREVAWRKRIQVSRG